MKREEQQIHLAVAKHLRLRGMPGLVHFHCPMGAHYASRFQGAMMQALGARKGVSDFILVYRSRIYCLELKSIGGRPTEEQLLFLSDMERQGAVTAIAVGIDQALKTLETWGLIKPSVTLNDVLRTNAERMERSA
jgi:hypothetical protein